MRVEAQPAPVRERIRAHETTEIAQVGVWVPSLSQSRLEPSHIAIPTTSLACRAGTLLRNRGFPLGQGRPAYRVADASPIHPDQAPEDDAGRMLLASFWVATKRAGSL